MENNRAKGHGGSLRLVSSEHGLTSSIISKSTIVVTLLFVVLVGTEEMEFLHGFAGGA